MKTAVTPQVKDMTMKNLVPWKNYLNSYLSVFIFSVFTQCRQIPLVKGLLSKPHQLDNRLFVEIPFSPNIGSLKEEPNLHGVAEARLFDVRKGTDNNFTNNDQERDRRSLSHHQFELSRLNRARGLMKHLRSKSRRDLRRRKANFRIPTISYQRHYRSGHHKKYALGRKTQKYVHEERELYPQSRITRHYHTSRRPEHFNVGYGDFWRGRTRHSFQGRRFHGDWTNRLRHYRRNHNRQDDSFQKERNFLQGRIRHNLKERRRHHEGRRKEYRKNKFRSVVFKSNAQRSNIYGRKGFRSNVYDSNGYRSNGRRSNIYGHKGFRSNGYQSNGYRENGHRSNEYKTIRHMNSGRIRLLDHGRPEIHNMKKGQFHRNRFNNLEGETRYHRSRTNTQSPHSLHRNLRRGRIKSAKRATSKRKENRLKWSPLSGFNKDELRFTDKAYPYKGHKLYRSKYRRPRNRRRQHHPNINHRKYEKDNVRKYKKDNVRKYKNENILRGIRVDIGQKRSHIKQHIWNHGLRKTKTLSYHVKNVRHKSRKERQKSVKVKAKSEQDCNIYRKKIQEMAIMVNHSVRKAEILAKIIGRKFGIDEKKINQILRKKEENISNELVSVF